MILVEMTDTFGGESNYSWVKRESYKDCESLKQAITRFKREQGIKVKHKITSESGDFRSVDLKGACIRIMAFYDYS